MQHGIEVEVTERSQRCRRAERAASVSDRFFDGIRSLTVAARQDEPLPMLKSRWNIRLTELGGWHYAT